MIATAIVAASCPYCRAPIEADEESVVCADCATPHHADCYAENGGCTVFGCSKAPLDEPKISIDTSEVSRYAPPASTLPYPGAAAPPPRTPPPPRRIGSTTSIPPPPSPNGASAGRIVIREDTTRYLTPPRTLNLGGYNSAPTSVVPSYIRRRTRVNYILFGIFLGAFGAHNFYAGYLKRATGQILLTVFVLIAGGYFWGGLVSWVWAIVEVLIVKQDDDGVAFI
jgi:hypothetical protein